MAYEGFIARRYLRSRSREAFVSLITYISMGGVAVGCMALIVVISVMAGFEADLRQTILGVSAHVRVEKPDGEFTHPGEVVRAVRDMDGVAAAGPFVKGQIMLRAPRQTMGVVLMGLDPATGAEGFGLAAHASPDAFAGLAGAMERFGVPGIVLGRELALHLGVGPGDSVQAISPMGTLTPVGMLPAMRRFVVTGTVGSGMYETDATTAWTDLATARRVFRMGEAVTGVELRLHDVYQAPEVAAAVRARLGPGFEVRDWAMLNSNLFAALKLEKTAMFVILSLIVLVAAFNIASTLIMTVMEKRRDIAILKAMGATGGSVRRIFMTNGMIIGTVGTAVGVGLGILLCVLLARYQFIHLDTDVFYIPNLPVRLQAADVVAISLAALGISLLSTVYPAWRAARTDPVEVLRYG